MDYIPYTVGGRHAWLINMRDNITAAGAAIGLAPATIAALKDAAGNQVELMDAAEAAEAAYNAANKEKATGEAINLKLIRTEVARIKTAPGYTPSAGEMLRVTAAADGFDPSTYKASIKGGIEGNVVRIKFTKKGVDGINIYHRKNGAASWDFLARDTKTPYDDHITLAVPGQPEHWEYRAFGVLNDVEIGLPSDIVEVVYGG